MASVIADKITRPDVSGRKALVTGTITLDPTAGVTTVTDPLFMPRLPVSILECLQLVPRTSPSYSTLRQTVRTNNAAIVAPGATKPTSIFTVVPILNSLKVFAHLSDPIDTYLLADNVALQGFLQAELLYGLTQAVESEVINGAGTAGHLTGFLATSGIQSQAAGAGSITTLRSAATALETRRTHPRRVPPQPAGLGEDRDEAQQLREFRPRRSGGPR
jgi:hypothetical protein